MDYKTLRQNPPKLEIKDNPKEIIFTLVSCMCNNISYVRFKKNDNGEFKLSHFNDHVGLAFTNLGCTHLQHHLEWDADNGKWDKVIEMLNESTSVIADVRSR